MQILHMNGGNGDTSYARNSAVQSKIMSLATPILEETVIKFMSKNLPSESIGIADLGCGPGSNTLNLVSEIITVLQNKCREIGKPLPELMVYLNDLQNNDFNSIFNLLPEFYRRLNIETESCFISGVPGSFYGRLFPRNSIHILHTSSSLHWRSKVPVELENDASKILNKGKLFISKSSPKIVVDAYSTQFHKDFSLFLKSRSKELVPGGRMVLSLMGRKHVDSISEEEFYQLELLAMALMSMVHEGLVEEQKVDSFNAPYYAPCPEEIKAEAEKEGSFVIDRLEAFPVDWDSGCRWRNGEFSAARKVAGAIRAVVESMLEAQFGNDIMDELFRRYEKLVENHLSKTRAQFINLVISMVRK